MKRLFKKNQIIITSLAIMIAAAGYLNYSGRLFGNDLTESEAELANQELLDISLESGDADIEETPGEAVLTNGEASGIVAEAKVTREQVRAKNKEALLEIIDNKNLSDAQKEEAVAQMIAMTEIAEKEASVETLLLSKGFSEVVVNLTETTADVVINAKELTDANLAQIEDIITRKTSIAPENIVITTTNK